MATKKTLAQQTLTELNKRGWLQGDFSAGNGKVCLVGAINAAATGDPYQNDGDGIKDEVIDLMGLLAMEIDESSAITTVDLYARGQMDYTVAQENLTDILASWNDGNGRKAKDVKDLIKQVTNVGV